MQFSNIAIVLAAASLTAAAPSSRATKQITCDDVSGSGTHLVLTSNADSQDKGYVAFNGQRDGQGRQNLVTLAADGSPAKGQNFHFVTCTSKHLKYRGANSNGRNYGQLRPANAPNHCVTVSKIKGENARLVSAKCTYDDDDTLLDKYWTISTNGFSMGLISHANGTDSEGYYKFSVGDTAHKKVQVDWTEGAFQDGEGYNLGFTNPYAINPLP